MKMVSCSGKEFMFSRTSWASESMPSVSVHERLSASDIKDASGQLQCPVVIKEAVLDAVSRARSCSGNGIECLRRSPSVLSLCWLSRSVCALVIVPRVPDEAFHICLPIAVLKRIHVSIGSSSSVELPLSDE